MMGEENTAFIHYKTKSPGPGPYDYGNNNGKDLDVASKDGG